MAEAPLEADGAAARLQEAAVHLERGDYGQVLRLLQPLAEQHGPATPLGGRVRLQMATALMGQGDSERAASLCRTLSACRDSLLRSQARDLLLVLEAPVLRRPAEWSLTLPPLPVGEALEGQSLSRRRPARQEPPPPPPPPVGPTRAPLGFAALAAALLLLLTFALSGCMRVRSEVRIVGPGRLQIGHQLVSSSGRSTPWQERMVRSLRQEGYRPMVERPAAGLIHLQGPVLPAEEALDALRHDLQQAAQLADVPLPAPKLELHQRNWLVGERQQLDLEFDLRALPAVEGLELEIGVGPLQRRAVGLADPMAARPARLAAGDQGVIWPLRPGALNHLQLRSWQWNPLGLGGLLIGLALLAVLGLQRLRLALGFGLPELPA